MKKANSKNTLYDVSSLKFPFDDLNLLGYRPLRSYMSSVTEFRKP